MTPGNCPPLVESAFETPLTEEESAIQQPVHPFAKNSLRAITQELDKMSMADVCAPPGQIEPTL